MPFQIQPRHLLLSGVALAVVWLHGEMNANWDFRARIDERYSICKANDLQVGLACDSETGSVYFFDMYPNTGPITGYVVTKTHILLKVYGRKSRNLFAGDTFQEVDRDRAFFLILDKSNNKLEGPFLEAEFLRQPLIRLQGVPNWSPARPTGIFGWIDSAVRFLGCVWGATVLYALTTSVITNIHKRLNGAVNL